MNDIIERCKKTLRGIEVVEGFLQAIKTMIGRS
jgi:hypothetical protein